MVVRMHNLSKWSRLEPGHALELKGDTLRKIRLEVNCDQPTSFYVGEGAGAVLLGVVQGLELFEFSAEGDVLVVPTTEGDVFYYTVDGGVDATDSLERSFTTLANRRTRNPQLELILWKQEQNMRRRELAIAEEVAAMRAMVAERQGADAETGEVKDEQPAVGAGDGAGGASGAAEASGGAAAPEKVGASDGKS